MIFSFSEDDDDDFYFGNIMIISKNIDITNTRDNE